MRHNLTTFQATEIQMICWEYFSPLRGFAHEETGYQSLLEQMRSVTSGWWRQMTKDEPAPRMVLTPRGPIQFIPSF